MAEKNVDEQVKGESTELLETASVKVINSDLGSKLDLWPKVLLICLIVGIAISLVIYSFNEFSQKLLFEKVLIDPSVEDDILNMTASIGFTTPEKASAWFLNQLTIEEYETLRDTLSFSGFLYIGWTECSYCLKFTPILQKALYELDMMDSVRSWDMNIHWEGEISDRVKSSLGADLVPALLYFTSDGKIRHLVDDFNNPDIEVIKKFLLVANE